MVAVRQTEGRRQRCPDSVELDRERGARAGLGRRLGLAVGLALAGLSALGPAAPAQAATVEHLSLEELVSRSEVVVVATVAAQGTRVETAPLRIFTETALTVESVLHGDKARPFMVLEQVGGVAYPGTPAEVRLEVPGYPTFEVGEQVVVFLERTPLGELVVCGLTQGKYTLRPDPKTGVLTAERDLHDLNVVRAPRAAEAHFAGVPSNLDRLPFADLVTLIEGGKLPVRPLRVLGPATPRVDLPAPPATEGTVR